MVAVVAVVVIAMVVAKVTEDQILHCVKHDGNMNRRSRSSSKNSSSSISGSRRHGPKKFGHSKHKGSGTSSCEGPDW